MEQIKDVRYGMIDILRVVFCILVITIHTEALKSFNENIYVADSLGIARLAVPFFLITTGYFLYNRITKENEPSCTIKKFCKLYIKWIIVEFLLVGIIILPFILQDPIPSIHRILFTGISGVLWYISALIFGLLFSYWFLKKDKIIPLFIIGCILYLFGSSADTYTSLFSGTVLSKLTDMYTAIFCGPNMGITVSVLFLSIGCLINKYNLNTKIKYLTPLTLGAILLVLVEAFTLIHLNIPKDYNMYLSVIIATPLLFMWALNCRYNISKKTALMCREYSLGIYCSHSSFMALSFYALPTIQNTVIRFLIVLTASFIFITIIRQFKLTRKLLK